MMKLEHIPSQSWRWDSHHSPSSRWLQSNIKELDEKVKAMLKLIAEDADSFAQRAEIYYKKRPELVNLVEEFHRAYLSLAERYDRFTGEIKQKIPKAVQIQYGLSCDSPRGSSFGKWHHSTFQRDQHGFGRLLKKFEAGQSEEQAQSEESEIQEDSSTELKENGLLQEKEPLSSSDSEVDNSTIIEKLQLALRKLEEENKKMADRCQISEMESGAMQNRMKEMEETLFSLQEEKIKWVDKFQAGLEESTSGLKNRLKGLEEELSSLRVENEKLADEASTRGIRLKELVEEMLLLQEEKRVLKEEVSQGLQKRDQLDGEIEGVQVECTRLRASVMDRADKIRNLEGQLRKLQDENERLASEVSAAEEHGNISMSALRFMKGEVSSIVQRNKSQREGNEDKADEVTSKEKEEELLRVQEEKTNLENELYSLYAAEDNRAAELNEQIKELQTQLTLLEEENSKQKIAILDRAEEKREAIRQLCFSMDILKDKNHRLEEALCSAKIRLHGLRSTASSYSLPTWKKVLLGAWTGPKPQAYGITL